MPKYYAVLKHKVLRDDLITHEVKGFDEENRLLLHTWHKGKVSMNLESVIWEGRGHKRRDELFFKHLPPRTK